MTDRLTPEQRSHVMSRIRSRNTRPEMVVRRFLWSEGYRYRLCVGKLPGRPDIVMRKLKVAIFINGCFWHGHDAHKRHTPKSNVDYWSKKIENNKRRDIENGIRLRSMGWTVITIWECELAPKLRAATLAALGETLRLLASTPYRRTDSDALNIAAEPEFSYSPS
ncbi:MAG: very short patch repair endonuclease [Muribaculaceae bacterium]|nr:very short patch repair endonuclease [Muribaculaceae bacterium]